MPLDAMRRVHAQQKSDHSLTFWMNDLSTKRIVEIVVDGIALEDIAHEEGREHSDLATLFSVYRSRVEQVASDKYDREDWDGRRITVDSSDF
jgi:hypothetical protein